MIMKNGTGPVILGIIAEYDPFHNGHARHLGEARRIVSPDAVYIALSPCFKQRGELSMLSPFARAACAVQAGADAVFALPVLWTVRDAEHYALGAVSLLNSLGVTHLAFGAETADLPLLEKTAALLEDPPDSVTGLLKTFLAEGAGYPAALSRSVSACFPEAGGFLAEPNNILAVCYLRGIRRLKIPVRPVVIPRAGGYHALRAEPESPSASALRSALYRGDYRSAFAAVPAYSAARIRQSFLSRRIPDPAVLDALLTGCLRSADLSVLPDLSEGLDSLLRKASAVSAGRAELMDRVVSRRYPAARISRLCAMALLGASAARVGSLPLPQRTLLLALRKKAALSDGWKDLPVRICSSAAEWKEAADPEDLRAWSLWAECCRLPDTLPFTEKLYTE